MELIDKKGTKQIHIEKDYSNIFVHFPRESMMYHTKLFWSHLQL